MNTDLREFNSIDLHQHSSRILVVDDGDVNRRLLKRVFVHDNEIVEAINGRQALEYLDSEKFDLVLLDIMMPDMSGLDVLQIIRQTPSTADLPVILISALDDDEHVIHGLQIGANDYITKPIKVDLVRARVATQLHLKRAIDAHKQSIAGLEAAQRMKDRLFSIASHDLKSPLSTVRLAEKLLRRYVPNDTNALEVLDNLRTTVNHMHSVIEEFLDMAAAQNASIDVQLEEVDVQQTVMNVASQHEITAYNKDIALSVGELPGVVYADPARLTQVLNNLVSNAIKYSPRHTTVTLSSEVQGDTVNIYIADQGPGIPVNERGRLFQEFSKLSTRPTDGESSTGLGLWIVKHMVTLQKGTVGVDCPPDGGSIFWVQLPAAVVSETTREFTTQLP